MKIKALVLLLCLLAVPVSSRADQLQDAALNVCFPLGHIAEQIMRYRQSGGDFDTYAASLLDRINRNEIDSKTARILLRIAAAAFEEPIHENPREIIREFRNRIFRTCLMNLTTPQERQEVPHEF